MKIYAHFLLLPSELGGRNTSAGNRYSPTWKEVRGDIEGSMSMQLEKDLSPGNYTKIILHPLVPDLWDSLVPGKQLAAYEGSRLIGLARIEKVV